jgi:hypothetical protein
VLDDGRLTDGHGRTVDFRNTVVIMTSNIRSAEEMTERFRPEFLNRIDEIVVFEALTREQLAEIVEMQLRRLNERLAERGITLDLTDGARELIAEAGWIPRTARGPSSARSSGCSRTRSRCGCSRASSARATRSARTRSSARSASCGPRRPPRTRKRRRKSPSPSASPRRTMLVVTRQKLSPPPSDRASSAY